MQQRGSSGFGHPIDGVKSVMASVTESEAGEPVKVALCVPTPDVQEQDVLQTWIVQAFPPLYVIET